MPQRIGIGSDHAGFSFKNLIKDHLSSKGFDVQDFGTDGLDSVDYPDYVHPLCSALENENIDCGFLVCGSANGVAMTANKHQGIRAAIAWNTELAALSRQHNNANILCIAERFTDEHLALAMVDVFLETAFEGGRHDRRVKKISLN